MTPRQALTKARKLFGPKAAVEFNPKAADADEKIELRAKRESLKAQHEKAKAAADARRAELLADPGYKQLVAEQVRLHRELSNTGSRLFGDRAKIGHISGVGGIGFFHIEAGGDTFDECFRKIEARKAQVTS